LFKINLRKTSAYPAEMSHVSSH